MSTDFDFPTNPMLGDQVIAPNGTVFTWDGEKWVIEGYTGTSTLLSNYVNVVQFGAKLDGVTDDSAAFLAARNAAQAMAGPNGTPIVYVPTGIYNVPTPPAPSLPPVTWKMDGVVDTRSPPLPVGTTWPSGPLAGTLVTPFTMGDQIENYVNGQKFIQRTDISAPGWQANTNYAAGTQISDGAHFHTAQNTGVSGARFPAQWGTTLGATTVDNTITWAVSALPNMTPVVRVEHSGQGSSNSANLTQWWDTTGAGFPIGLSTIGTLLGVGFGEPVDTVDSLLGTGSGQPVGIGSTIWRRKGASKGFAYWSHFVDLTGLGTKHAASSIGCESDLFQNGPEYGPKGMPYSAYVPRFGGRTHWYYITGNGLPAWSANHAYSVGDVITDWNSTQICVIAGTSGAVQPNPTGHWLANRSYPLGAQIIDSNGNFQSVQVAGRAGTTAPVWATAVGGTTTENAGTVIALTWVMVAPVSTTWALSLPDWHPNSTYAVGEFILDLNLNIQTVTTAGVSGLGRPTWATALGATTTDGTVVWQVTAPGSTGRTNDGTVVWLAGTTHNSQVSRAIGITASPGHSHGAGLLAEGTYYDAVIEMSGATYDNVTNPNTAAIRIGSDAPIDFSGSQTQAGQNNRTLKYNSTSNALEYAYHGTPRLSLNDSGSVMFSLGGSQPIIIDGQPTNYISWRDGGHQRWQVVLSAHSPPLWLANTAYPTAGAQIFDGTNIQQVLTTGTSGATAPTWATSGNTSDGTVVWQYVSAPPTSNAGGDLTFQRYSDAGTYLGTPLSLSRSTGAVTIGTGGLALGTAGQTINGGIGAATGTQPKGSIWMRTDGGVGTTMYVSQGSGIWNAVAGV